MKKLIIQILSDWSVPESDFLPYEERVLLDTDFEKVADVIIEVLSKEQGVQECDATKIINEKYAGNIKEYFNDIANGRD